MASEQFISAVEDLLGSKVKKDSPNRLDLAVESINDLYYTRDWCKRIMDSPSSSLAERTRAAQILTNTSTKIINSHESIREIITPKKTEFNYYVPYPWQAHFDFLFWDYINNSYNTRNVSKQFVLVAGRQLGKTIAVANTVAKFALLTPGSYSFYILPSYNLVESKIIPEIKKVASCKYSKSGHTLKFPNSSKLKFVSYANRETVVGDTCTGVMFVDEAAIIPKIWFDEVMRPFCREFHAPIVFLSAPKLKAGLLWEMYNNPNCTVIDWSNYQPIMEAIKPGFKEELDLARSSVSEMTFNSQYLGNFIDTDQHLFPHQEDCFVLPFEERFDLISKARYLILPDVDFTAETIFGVDWAENVGTDHTSIVAFQFVRNEDDVITGLKQVLYYNINLGGCDPAVKAFDFFKQMFKNSRIQFEMNSAGGVIYQLLPDRNNVDRINVTNDVKRLEIDALSYIFEKRMIKMFDFPDTIEQFIGYRIYEPRPGSLQTTIRFSNDPLYADHDDDVMSTAHAVYYMYRRIMTNKTYRALYEEEINKSKLESIKTNRDISIAL